MIKVAHGILHDPWGDPVCVEKSRGGLKNQEYREGRQELLGEGKHPKEVGGGPNLPLKPGRGILKVLWCEKSDARRKGGI